MSSETARRVVVGAALLGVAVAVYQGRSQPAKTTYKRVWGLLLLVAGGSVLADLAPAVVGPYMLLVLLGFLITNQKDFGALFSSAAKGVNSATKGG